ncbi:MAG: hypothetical protein RR744_01750, partial [Cellulosilyticaceae bacterium]
YKQYYGKSFFFLLTYLVLSFFISYPYLSNEGIYTFYKVKTHLAPRGCALLVSTFIKAYPKIFITHS